MQTEKKTRPLLLLYLSRANHMVTCCWKLGDYVWKVLLFTHPVLIPLPWNQSEAEHWDHCSVLAQPSLCSKEISQ